MTKIHLTDQMLSKTNFSTMPPETRKQILQMVLSCVGPQQDNCWDWCGIINKIGHGRIKLPVQEYTGFTYEKLDTVHTVKDGEITDSASLYGGVEKYQTKYRWIAVHRLMYMLCYDWLWERDPKTDKPLVVYHACGNPNCCNPLHLVLKPRGFGPKFITSDVSTNYKKMVAQLLENLEADRSSPLLDVDQALEIERIIPLLQKHVKSLDEFDAIKYSNGYMWDKFKEL